MNTAAIRTAARIARFSIVKPAAHEPAADHIRRDGTDGNAPDARPQGRRRVRARARRSPAWRTPSTSARSGKRSAGAARRAAGRRAGFPGRFERRGSRSRTRNRRQRVVELARQRRERPPERGGAPDDHESRVGRRGLAHRAVRLAETAPGAVALHGAPNLPAHGKSGAARLVRRTPEYDHGRPVNSLAPLERSEEHTSELQSLTNLVCRLLLEKK